MGLNQTSIHNHLLKMATLPNLINADLKRGFTVAQVAEKHAWTDPMVWSQALKDKNDRERFKALGGTFPGSRFVLACKFKRKTRPCHF